ncbi:hypothetical protein BaRGS_00016767 [Batillaria attramentaria]|uniref:Uncharacterized protein n=1 Tax=Batillaria attramentaria TaxID=370345 RepID=A0ABD0KXA3_9CAEN
MKGAEDMGAKNSQLPPSTRLMPTIKRYHARESNRKHDNIRASRHIPARERDLTTYRSRDISTSGRRGKRRAAFSQTRRRGARIDFLQQTRGSPFHPAKFRTADKSDVYLICIWFISRRPK